jgi:glyceraldehyde 3-phosphate dehydrogenase
MPINIGINGFGRIGKVVYRILGDYPEIKVVGINDLMDVKTLVHLLKFDSTHGKFIGTVEEGYECIYVDGQKVVITHFPDPQDIPWKELKVDYVMESSGRFTSKVLLNKHILAGARKVILSSPPQDKLDRCVVMSVNDHELIKDDKIISNASCTTNCLAPVLKILDEHFGIDRAFMNTVHPFTNNQAIIDAPHKDLRRGRNAGTNIIPTTTTAIAALTSVMPEMKDRFDGLAVRVPVHDGSLIEICAILKRSVTVDEVNRTMKKAADSKYRGILSYTEDPVVSSDIIGDPHSAIFDALSTRVLGGNYIQLIVWYDNESGYSHRVIDLMMKMGRMDGLIGN